METEPIPTKSADVLDLTKKGGKPQKKNYMQKIAAVLWNALKSLKGFILKKYQKQVKSKGEEKKLQKFTTKYEQLKSITNQHLRLLVPFLIKFRIEEELSGYWKCLQEEHGIIIADYNALILKLKERLNARGEDLEISGFVMKKHPNGSCNENIFELYEILEKNKPVIYTKALEEVAEILKRKDSKKVKQREKTEKKERKRTWNEEHGEQAGTEMEAETGDKRVGTGKSGKEAKRRVEQPVGLSGKKASDESSSSKERDRQPNEGKQKNRDGTVETHKKREGTSMEQRKDGKVKAEPVKPDSSLKAEQKNQQKAPKPTTAILNELDSKPKKGKAQEEKKELPEKGSEMDVEFDVDDFLCNNPILKKLDKFNVREEKRQVKDLIKEVRQRRLASKSK